MIEPDAFGKNKFGDKYHFNKWSKYAVGLARPSKKVVEAAERKIPGGVEILYHPVWEILRKGFSEHDKGSAWFDRLAPEIRHIIARNEIAAISFPITQYYHSIKQLQMLERRAGLDALACLSLLLIDAIKAGQSDLALDVSRSLFRSLILMCMTKPYSYLEDLIFYCFSTHLLNRVECDGEVIAFGSIQFSELITLLQWKILSLEDAGVLWRTREELFRGCLQILNGKYGIEFGRKFALPMGKIPPD